MDKKYNLGTVIDIELVDLSDANKTTYRLLVKDMMRCMIILINETKKVIMKEMMCCIRIVTKEVQQLLMKDVIFLNIKNLYYLTWVNAHEINSQTVLSQHIYSNNLQISHFQNHFLSNSCVKHVSYVLACPLHSYALKIS